MRTPIRLWHCVVVPSLSILVAAFSGDRPAPGPASTQGLGSDPAACGKCHVENYKEWKQTQHAVAWTDEIYQHYAQAKRRPSRCYRCHVPENVLENWDSKATTREDESTFVHGVHCATCHVKGDAVHGPYGNKTDAHKSVKDELFAEVSTSVCLKCHSTSITPVIPLGRDYEKTGLLTKEKKTCVTCHMKLVKRAPSVDPETGKPVGEKRKMRSHHILGPNDKRFIAQAFDFAAVPKGDKVSLEFSHKAGHRVPGLKIRKFQVFFEALDDSGKVLWSKTEEIDHRHPLEYGQKLTVEVAKPDGTKRFQVRVHHWFAARKDEWKDLGQVYTAKR